MNRTPKDALREAADERRQSARHKRAGRTGSAQEVVAASQRFFFCSNWGKIQEASPGLRRAAAAGYYPDDPAVWERRLRARQYRTSRCGVIEHYRILLDTQPDTVLPPSPNPCVAARSDRIRRGAPSPERAALLALTHANTAFALAELLGQQRRNGRSLPSISPTASCFVRKSAASGDSTLRRSRQAGYAAMDGDSGRTGGA